MKRLSVTSLIRMARWHRLGLGLAALAVAMIAGVTVVTTALRGPTSPVVVAAADIPPGTQVTGSNLALVDWPAELVPVGALTSLDSAIGKTVIGRVNQGVPLTGDMFTVAALRNSEASEVLVPVRTRDAAMLELLSPGSLVTLIGVAGEGYAETLATRVRVAVLPGNGGSGVMGQSDGALLIVACNRSDAARIAAAAGMTITVIIE